jgi:hypothetical protein
MTPPARAAWSKNFGKTHYGYASYMWFGDLPPPGVTLVVFYEQGILKNVDTDFGSGCRITFTDDPSLKKPNQSTHPTPASGMTRAVHDSRLLGRG